MSFWTPVENPGTRPPRSWAFDIGCALLAALASRIVLLEVLSCAKADAEGGALGDARPGRDVAQPHAPVAGDAQRHPGTVGQEAPVRHARKLL